MRLRLDYLMNALLPLAAASAAAAAAPGEPDPAKIEFFEKKIRPILVSNCYTCHSAETKPSGGLRVDDRNGLLYGGNGGAAIVPGDPDKSLLLKRITQPNEKRRMPLQGESLSAEQIADLTTWIKDGAAWPAVRVPASFGKPKASYEKLRKEHWAWQPLRNTALPKVADAAWPRSDVDRFLLAGLEARGLRPVGDADRATLIRRVTFDLTGLPPTPEEIDAFLKDTANGAFERVVDRLLASPAFGERWGRHWLDVARYAESTGSSRNVPYPHAWRYRSYVIDAFNADLPYDQFVTEQIAGDLLPAASTDERIRQSIATGFLALGVKDVNQRFRIRFVMDNIDEQIDTVSRSVLAVTASCARCHDHKFDPIPTTDYYALAGIFHSTELCAGVRSKMGGGGLDYYDPTLLVRISTGDKPAAPAEQIQKLNDEVAKARAEFEAIRGTPEGLAKGPGGRPVQRGFRMKYEQLRSQLLELTDPARQGEAAVGVREGKMIGDTEVRVRGEAEKAGPQVPRGFLTVIDVPGATKVNPTQSGRLELAQWLTSAKNPLTPRVLVNRVWQHLFGEGLVTTVDNFGINGALPSHPELLDHVAARFVADGWSVKRLVRTLVLSRAYQLSAEAPAANVAADPMNRLVWRHRPRRLDAEEIRDAALAVAGALDQSRPAAPVSGMTVRELRNNGPEARQLGDKVTASRHRSVYLPLLRGLTPRSLEVFDFAEQGMVTGRRDTTTVPSQALYLLNDPFVRRQALALAERLLRGAGRDDAGRISQAFRLVVGREATPAETTRVAAYLADYERSYPQRPTAAPAQTVVAAADKPKQAEPEDPDQIDQTDAPVTEDNVQPPDAKTAAWMSFCQVLLGSAEFRYAK